MRHQEFSNGVLELRGVTVGYEDKVVLDHVDLAVERGESLVLLGPNGAGKSTLIRTMAGLLPPWSGSVWISGQDVADVPTNARGVGLIFRSHGLFANMTVRDNIYHSLRASGVERLESLRRIAGMLGLMRLDGLEDQEVGQLSRGQQQQANLARVLATEPGILLLHEPLSDVDDELRRELGEGIRQLQRSKGFTVVMATRNRRDAFLMADRFAVLRAGRLEQIGDPASVYRQPRSAFVATLTGEANLVPGRVSDDGGEGGPVTVSSVLGTMRCRGVGLSRGQEALLLIRPEALNIVQGQPKVGPSGTVTDSSYFGSHSVTKVDVQGQTLTVHTCEPVGTQPPVGARVHLSVRYDDCHVLAREATSN